jgi:hypothetical protein
MEGDGEQTDNSKTCCSYFYLAMSKFKTGVSWWFGVYFHVHFLFFIVLGVVGGVILFLLEGGEQNHKFIDTLFMSVSAVTETGLGSIDISTMRIGTQVAIWFLILSGGVILFSSIPPLIRRVNILKALEDAEKSGKKGPPIYEPGKFNITIQ